MDITECDGLEAVIVDYQATYLVLSIGSREIRFDLRGKKEFQLTKGSGGSCQLLSEHPLLVNYNEPWQETFINSRLQDPEELVNQVRAAIQQRLGNWRSWSSYIQKLDAPESVFQRIVSAGSGLLSYAPISITEAITKVCQANGIATWSTAGDYEVTQSKLLFVGSSYVIAQAFIQRKD